jgi:uncharacterized protein YlxW (UPF0749 family)
MLEPQPPTLLIRIKQENESLKQAHATLLQQLTDSQKTIEELGRLKETYYTKIGQHERTIINLQDTLG